MRNNVIHNAGNVALTRSNTADSREMLSPFGSASGLLNDWSPFLSASPFELLGRMQQDMDRWFSQVMGVPHRNEPRQGGAMLPTTTLFSPTVDVSETERNYQIDIDLPGIPQDAIDVRVVEGTLVVRAETQQERTSGDENAGEDENGSKRQYHYCERRWGRFERVFHLPPIADDENLAANFEAGVLTITIPKKQNAVEQTRGRRIPIGSSESTDTPQTPQLNVGEAS